MSELDDFTTPCRVCGARGDTSVCSERCADTLERQDAALADLISVAPEGTSARERAEYRDQRRHERLTGERGREGKY